jgi:hypothetical protein
LNAVDSLANGVHKGPMDLTEFSRSLTGLYQLLPVFECYDGGDGKFARVGEVTGIPNIDAARAAGALQFHREIEKAVEANRKIDAYGTGGYRIYPIVGIAQETKLTARLAGTAVEMSTAWNGKVVGGDGTVPRVSAIPIEMSDDSKGMFAATQHGSLQNAEAVLDHLGGVLTGLDLNLGAFKKVRVQVALEIEDLFMNDETIAVRARPTAKAELTATLWRGREAKPIANAVMQSAADGWSHAKFPPMAGGTYRVTVDGDNVEPAEDAFAVLASED